MGHNCEIRVRQNEWRTKKRQPLEAAQSKETVGSLTQKIPEMEKTTAIVSTPKGKDSDSRNQGVVS